MTDPFASEGNGELGANPNPNPSTRTPGDDQTMPDPQHTAGQPGAEQPGMAEAQDQTAKDNQGNPIEPTASPWAASDSADVSEPFVAGESTQPAPGAVTGGTPGSPYSSPPMPPPGAPAGQPPSVAPSGAPFGVQPDTPMGGTAFGQEPVAPGAGWSGSQPSGFSPGGHQAASGQVNPGTPPGLPPGMPPQGAHPMGSGAASPGPMPQGSVPPGSVPPGQFPPGQYPPGGMPSAGQPKPYSPLPWIILAVVLSIGLLIMMAISAIVLMASEHLGTPVIDTNEDTTSEFIEFAPDFNETVEPSISATKPSEFASDIASLPTQETLPPASIVPATPGAPAPASGSVPFTVPDPAQIQGDAYHDFDSPEGITVIGPMDIAVGETKEGKVGPEQMVPVKVNLTKGQKVTIAVKGELFGDYRFWVSSPANVLVAFGDDSIDTETKDQTLDPRIAFEAKADGIHTIWVNNSFSVAESAFKISVNE